MDPRRHIDFGLQQCCEVNSAEADCASMRPSILRPDDTALGIFVQKHRRAFEPRARHPGNLQSNLATTRLFGTKQVPPGDVVIGHFLKRDV